MTHSILTENQVLSSRDARQLLLATGHTSFTNYKLIVLWNGKMPSCCSVFGCKTRDGEEARRRGISFHKLVDVVVITVSNLN